VYKIPVDVLQKTVDYLATRPYSEVHSLIPDLINLDKVEVEQVEEDQTNDPS
jgi:hypothetical protein